MGLSLCFALGSAHAGAYVLLSQSMERVLVVDNNAANQIVAQADKMKGVAAKAGTALCAAQAGDG